MVEKSPVMCVKTAKPPQPNPKNWVGLAGGCAIHVVCVGKYIKLAVAGLETSLYFFLELEK